MVRMQLGNGENPSLGNGENPKRVWLLTVYEQLGLHWYAVSTHPDELVFEPSP